MSEVARWPLGASKGLADLEAEHAVVCSCIFPMDSIVVALALAPILLAESFSDPVLGEVYRTACALAASGRRPEPGVIAQALVEDPIFRAAGGYTFLVGVARGIPRCRWNGLGVLASAERITWAALARRRAGLGW